MSTTTARRCFWLDQINFNDALGFPYSEVVEDEGGHEPKGWINTDDLQQAERQVDGLNAALGVDRAAMLEIVASSMRLSHPLQLMIGKTIAGYRIEDMEGREVTGKPLRWTQITLTFTDGTTHSFVNDPGFELEVGSVRVVEDE